MIMNMKKWLWLEMKDAPTNILPGIWLGRFNMGCDGFIFLVTAYDNPCYNGHRYILGRVPTIKKEQPVII